MYRLSGTLKGHEQDVKSVVAVDNDIIASGLRDSTLRVWTRGDKWSTTDPIIAYHAEGIKFINAVSYLDTHRVLASAGQEGIVYLTDISTIGTEQEPSAALIGHSMNICSLTYNQDTLVSSSWDGTAIVWDLESLSPRHTLTGHEGSVWDAIALGNDEYLTCSADRSIRRWSGSKQIATYLGHTDVVRKLLILPGGLKFASCSNDGSIIIWDLNHGVQIKKLLGHESFIYDLASLPNGDIVSAGEDRTVRIWSTDDASSAVQAITLPSVSVWCVDTLPNGDIVAGGSDKVLRVFTSNPSRYAEVSEIQQLSDDVKGSTIAEQTMNELKRTDIPGYDALTRPGKQEGSTIMVKNPTGVIEAHQWSSGEWVKIGDVVGSGGGSGSGSGSKVEYLGQQYDFVFDVDIEDGAPPLKLPYNANDNPYEAADKFLSENELPASYKDEVVNFIMKNTEGIELGGNNNTAISSSAPSNDPYSDSYQRKKQQTSSLKVIPQLGYVFFNEYKADQLIRGLTKLNSEQGPELQLTEIELSNASESLKALTSKKALALITDVVPKIMQWTESSRLIGYDILRVSVQKVTTVDILQSTTAAEVISSSISSGLSNISETTLPLFMMLLKLLSNLVGTTLLFQLYFTSNEGGKAEFSEDFVKLLQSLADIVGNTLTTVRTHKHFTATTLALSTFILNMSVLQLKNSTLTLTMAGPMVDFTNSVGPLLAEASSESAYRLVIGYANYQYAKVAFDAPWLGTVKSLYVDKLVELRFVDVLQDIKGMQK